MAHTRPDMLDKWVSYLSLQPYKHVKTHLSLSLGFTLQTLPSICGIKYGLWDQVTLMNSRAIYKQINSQCYNVIT